MSTPNNAKPKIITLRRIWKLISADSFKTNKIRLAIAAVAMIASKLSLVMVPAVFKNLIDTLSKAPLSIEPSVLEKWGTVIYWIVLYGAFRVLSAFSAEIRDTQFTKITQRALRTLGLSVFDHLHNLSLRFHIGRQTGGVARIIERGTKSIETLITFLTFNIIPTGIEMILVSIALYAMYGSYYTISMTITMFAYITYTIKLTEWRISYVREMNAMDTKAQAKAIDSLLNYETVKYFNNEQHEHNRFDKALIRYEAAAVASRWSLAYLNFGQAMILSCGLVWCMIIAAQDVKRGAITVGDLVAINTFLIQLTFPLFNLGFAYREIKLALVNIEDMYTLLEEPYEIVDHLHNAEKKDLIDKITFENVSFHYEKERAILKNISFTIHKGETVAIVGSSGAGKSTISRLLFRFYDVIEGHIRFDGVDCRDIKQASLRALIGIVPQDTVLFNDTIYYNIAYGNPHATEADVKEAAQKAEIYNFILSLPQGFETLVGERGLKLSGGEKQRVAIARTLLKKPEFFIFDEATSALDTKTEKQIQENLERISRDKTTLIIAHRLSTVVHANTIIVLDKGEIAEQGCHTTLMQANGLYTQMWERQQHERSETTAE